MCAVPATIALEPAQVVRVTIAAGGSLLVTGPAHRYVKLARMPARGAARKGQGQWALGYHEPLNPNERTKRDNDGLLVRQRIIDIYSKRGFASIDPGDLRGRFRWYGLYTQRRQGIPGGRTAILEPDYTDPIWCHRSARPAGQSGTHDRCSELVRQQSIQFWPPLPLAGEEQKSRSITRLEAIIRGRVDRPVESSEDGDMFVVRSGTSFELIARNPMGEPLMATPALAGGAMFVRGERHLFAIQR